LYVVRSEETNGARRQIDIRELLTILGRRKWWIVGITGFLTGLAIIYSLVVTERYRAEAVVIQRDSKSLSGLSGQLAQLGGLADLAGLGLGQGAKQEPMGLLRSKGFIRRFIERNNLLPVLAENSRGALGSSSRTADIRIVVDRFMRRNLSISEDKKAGLVTVAVEWKEAALAANWANGIVRQVNAEMRARVLRETGHNIAYLRNALDSTDSVALQQAVARLLESEMEKAMLAGGTADYAFRVIDEAQPPVRRSFPKRSMIVLLAFVTSLFTSSFIVLLVEHWKEPMARRDGGLAPQ
jgi:uncharacterized protein involved in exopolysaccharide biosynthesis